MKLLKRKLIIFTTVLGLTALMGSTLTGCGSRTSPAIVEETETVSDKDNLIEEDIVVETPTETVIESPVETVLETIVETTVEGEVITTKKEEMKIIIPFVSESKNNASLEKGKTLITQTGQNGIETIIYETVYKNDVEQKKTEISRVVTKTPVKQITEIGTKAVTSSTPIPTPTPTPKPAPVILIKEETKTENISFSTEKVNDSTLEKGKEVVSGEGVNGVRTIIYSVTYTDGKETNRVEKSNSITTQPISKIIKVGTKEPEPAKTSYDNLMPAGYLAVIANGMVYVFHDGREWSQEIGASVSQGASFYPGTTREEAEVLLNVWIQQNANTGVTIPKSDVNIALDACFNDVSSMKFKSFSYFIAEKIISFHRNAVYQ